MTTDTKNNPPASKVPDWVQPDLFVDVLKESVKRFSKIRSFKAESGSAAGENYATIMLRVIIVVELVDGNEKTVSYMLKVPHLMELCQKMMERNNIFEAERSMYNIFIPELEQIYCVAGLDVKFGAKAYELKDAKTDYILLEDLSTKGFKNMNRLEGLDQVHIEAALQRLAQWHAASAVRVAIKGLYPDQLNTSFFKEENRALMVKMNKQISQNFVKSCATYEGNEEYIEQVRALQPKLVEGMYKMAKLDPSEFNVLNHGDFGETLLVDFQMPKYGTVAKDLYYFLLSSTKFEDKLRKFDYYVKFYHENLAKNLKLLKYAKAMPCLRDIHLTLFRYSFLGYLTATDIMTDVLLDPSEDANLEMFLSGSKESNEFKSLINTNPRFRKHIQVELPWLLNRGALEI